jgi:hypothetical protein
MKGIWKIFEYEKFDVLATKSFIEKEQKYTLDFSICPQVGNTATMSLSFSLAIETVDAEFARLTPESVLTFANYIIDSLGGHGIFDNGGPDEIEYTTESGSIVSFH